MPFTPDLIDEMEVLALFKHDSSQEGIKITSTASPSLIAAAQRLPVQRRQRPAPAQSPAP